jgi:hypothetical protein
VRLRCVRRTVPSSVAACIPRSRRTAPSCGITRNRCSLSSPSRSGATSFHSNSPPLPTYCLPPRWLRSKRGVITCSTVFLLAFYDAFYISPAKAKRAAEVEATTAAMRGGIVAASNSAISPGSTTSSDVGRPRGHIANVDGSSGGAVASPDRRRSVQKPLWEGT